jgi:glutamate synthase (NADPH) small chain
VFAGGDIVTGAATVILAMGAGRRAARGMLEYMGVLSPEGELAAVGGR